MSENETGSIETPANTPAASREAQWKRGFKRVLIAFEILLLLVLAAVLLVKFTPKGQDIWTGVAGGERPSEAQLAAEKQAGIDLEEHGAIVIAELPNRRITKVSFRQKQATDEMLGHLGPLFRLGTLDLSKTNISDDQLHHLAGLTSLSCLILNHNPITDAGLEHLKHLDRMTALYLPGTRITDDGLLAVAQIEDLAVLDLGATRVTDEGLRRLAPLKHLTWLVLKDNPKITDVGLESLAGVTSLGRLSLGNTQVTVESIRALVKAVPSLKVEDVNK